jgi:hypothetical protein
MDGIECATVGVAFSFHPETGACVVLLTMQDEDGETVAWTHMTPEVASQVTLGIAARTFEAQTLEREVQALPNDERAEGIRKIHDRLYSGLN